MNTFKIITAKERSKYIVEELGDKVIIENYDDESDRVTFVNFTDLDLLLVLHAGIRYGHDSLKEVLMVK
jgi:hypothetical protein